MNETLYKLKKNYPTKTTVILVEDIDSWEQFKKNGQVKFTRVDATTRVALFQLELTDKGFEEYENMQFELEMGS